MDPTSVSLLDRLKVARPDASDWGRLQGIYLPLIRRWLGRVPGLGDEADDLAQEVFVVVVREIPGSTAAGGVVPGVAAAGDGQQGPELPRRRHRRPAVGPRPGRRVPRTPGRPGRRPGPGVGPGPRPVTSSRSSWRSCSRTSSPTTWEAFRRFALDGVPAGRVAEELGMTENAVLLAKSRVLKRLREEAGDLLG